MQIAILRTQKVSQKYKDSSSRTLIRGFRSGGEGGLSAEESKWQKTHHVVAPNATCSSGHRNTLRFPEDTVSRSDDGLSCETCNGRLGLILGRQKKRGGDMPSGTSPPLSRYLFLTGSQSLVSSQLASSFFIIILSPSISYSYSLSDPKKMCPVVSLVAK